MNTLELLHDTERLSRDFMELAMETEGAVSGIAAECSQRLRDLYGEFYRRFESNGALAE